MTVTVSDVVIFLSGTLNGAGTGYTIYGHDVLTTSITQKIGLSTRYWEAFMTASVLTQSAQLVDDLILHDVAFRIVYCDIMGALMVSGFSYSTLQLSVNLGNFPQIVQDMATSLLAAVRNYINILSTSGDTYDVTSTEDDICTDYIP